MRGTRPKNILWHLDTNLAIPENVEDGTYQLLTVNLCIHISIMQSAELEFGENNGAIPLPLENIKTIFNHCK